MRGSTENGASPDDDASLTFDPSTTMIAHQTASLSPAEFRTHFSCSDSGAPRRAVIIDGLMEIDGGWPARKNWQLAALRAAYGDCVVNAGEDPTTKAERELPLSTVLDKVADGDASAYVFEANFAERLPGTRGDYVVPRGFFSDDVLHIMRAVHEERVASTAGGFANDPFGVPDYRWLLLGAQGSGTKMHQDPPHMSSWNACVVGAKQWAFVDPAIVREGVTGDDICGCSSSGTDPGGGSDLTVAEWFATVLPALREKHPSYVRTLLQPAGSIVYFPPHVWHCVMNIQDSVAVTESYVARRDFNRSVARARAEVRTEREEMITEAAAAAAAAAGVTSESGATAATAYAEREPAAEEEEEAVAAKVDADFGLECVTRTRMWIRAVERAEEAASTEVENLETAAAAAAAAAAGSSLSCVLGDLGGTSCRLQLVKAGEDSAAAPVQLFSQTYATAAATSFDAMLLRFLADAEAAASAGGSTFAAPAIYSLAVCGPVSADGISVLLAPAFGAQGWHFSAAELSAALPGTPTVLLLNDFHAVGLALGSVPHNEVWTLVESELASDVAARAARVNRTCPCCKYFTLTNNPYRGGGSGFECCAVCAWKDDERDDKNAAAVLGGPNGDLSLTQARENFRSFGACDRDSIGSCRRPTPSEVPTRGARDGVLACLGPGSGLGQCFAIPSGDRSRRVFPSEGGMSDFVPRGAEEVALRDWIAARDGSGAFVEVEKVVSGAGIASTYAYLREAHPTLIVNPALDAAICAAAATPGGAPAALIGANCGSCAVGGGEPLEVGVDPLCARAVGIFLDALGAEAANLACRFKATGGVYIAGGTYHTFQLLSLFYSSVESYVVPNVVCIVYLFCRWHRE